MSRPNARGVLFDVGNTLLDEGPRLEAALRWLAPYLTQRGVPVSRERLRTLYVEACLAPRTGIGGLLVQTALAAGADEALARAQRGDVPWDAVGMPPMPGALDALRALHAAGLRVGVLANQPASARDDLERVGLLALLDDVWLSEVVGLEKPDPKFFRLALAAWNLPAERVAYVGDRPDIDVAPARALGFHAVRVLLGPHAREPERTPGERADYRAATLADAARHVVAWSRPVEEQGA
jgi:HAD superfamily hydrolase (TIGR01509 family)